MLAFVFENAEVSTIELDDPLVDRLTFQLSSLAPAPTGTKFTNHPDELSQLHPSLRIQIVRIRTIRTFVRTTATTMGAERQNSGLASAETAENPV
jgi:hypothetical protein